MTTLADLRREYASRALTEADADTDPIEQFRKWFADAVKAQIIDMSAMTLATASATGAPSARTVLLKGFDEHGFVFYTNYESAKARDLAENPRACLLLFWTELERQVSITGAVTRTTTEESEQYFRSRPRESQIGAAVSRQSHVVQDRAELERAFAEHARKLENAVVPMPATWGGYRLKPDVIEFWQGRKSRLHDRLLYTRKVDGSWSRARLAP